MIWRFPVNLDEKSVSREVVPGPELLSLKDGKFVNHLAIALSEEEYLEVKDLPPSYLKALYPSVYYYGPRVYETEKLMNNLLEEIKEYGADILLHLDSREVHSSIDFSDEELAYHINLLKTE